MDICALIVSDRQTTSQYLDLEFLWEPLFQPLQSDQSK